MAYISTNPVLAAIFLSFAGVVITFLYVSVRQYWKLRHVPGPFAAKFTNLWLMQKFWNNENFTYIAKGLSEKYGPVVRYGPDRVLFSDPAAVPIIMGVKNALRKAESYEIGYQLVNGELITSFATTRDEGRISAIKKHIMSAFATTAILDYEHHVDRNINYLMSRLTDSSDTEINIAKWTIFFTFDTICNIAFSDDQGFMEKQSDLGNAMKGARERFEHWHNWQSVPKVEKLLFKNSLVSRATGTSPLAVMARERLQMRLDKGGRGTYSDLLDRYLQAGQRDPKLFDTKTIIGLCISIIHAGAETTAAALNLTLLYLLRNPRTFEKLKDEIRSADLSSPPAWPSVSKLRYLEASLKEAMRMQPLVLDPMERDVPPSGLEIAGVFIPGGTVVAVNTHALNRVPSVWGADVETYRPERWLEADEAQLAVMERSNIFFSAGRRSCVGQHIAWIEMKKLLPELINRFDIELINPERKYLDPKGMVLYIDELPVRLTPRKY